MSQLPTEVKIIDMTYRVEYVERPSDVDIFRRESLWGQCDFWTRTIRVYASNRPAADVHQTIWHELIHAICEKMHIRTDAGDLNDNETAIDLLATAINAILQDNPMLGRRQEEGE